MQIANLYFALQQIKKLQQIDRGLELAKEQQTPVNLPWLGHVHPRQLFEEKSSQNSANRAGFVPYKRARVGFVSRSNNSEIVYKKPLTHAVSQTIHSDSKMDAPFARPDPLPSNSLVLEQAKPASLNFLTPKKEFTTGSYPKLLMTNSRQSTQGDTEESQMHGQTFGLEDSPNDMVTPIQLHDDESIQSVKSAINAKPASSGLIKISLARPPLISAQIKANEESCAQELDHATWRSLTEQENTCRRCITRAAKSQFGQKRARKSSLSYLFPCDVGMKAFLRKVRSLLQRRITENVSKVYDVADQQIT